MHRLALALLALTLTSTGGAAPTLPAISGAAAPFQPAASARAGPAPPVPIAPFTWPLAPPHPVLRRFEAPPAPWAAGHRGVDLGGTPGEPVLAVADGVVVYAGRLADRPLVSVAHPGGLHSTYEPVLPTVTPGQQVHRGDLLGHLQPGHCPAAPACLHWGLRRGEEYLDPLTLMSPHHVRLLPWQDP